MIKWVNVFKEPSVPGLQWFLSYVMCYCHSQWVRKDFCFSFALVYILFAFRLDCSFGAWTYWVFTGIRGETSTTLLLLVLPPSPLCFSLRITTARVYLPKVSFVSGKAHWCNLTSGSFPSHFDLQYCKLCPFFLSFLTSMGLVCHGHTPLFPLNSHHVRLLTFTLSL